MFFDGDERKYEQWEVKFLGYMRLQKLKDTILPSETPPDVGKNEEAFAELIQFLDDRSLSLVMRDAVDDGRKALAILRNHYAGKGKPRIISLYTELTSLHKSSSESVTDYVIKAETAATALRNAGETISDGLLIAMVLKGLPAEYKPFVVVTTQSEKQMSFREFKVTLRNFEDTENARTVDDESVVMKTYRASMHKTRNHVGKTGNPTGNLTCFACGQRGHKAQSCDDKMKNRLWCSFCKTTTHTDKSCRRKPRESVVKHMNSYGDNSDSQSFAFKVDVFNHDDVSQANALLVDCGATTHVVTDALRFVLINSSMRRNISLNLQMVPSRIMSLRRKVL